MSKPTPLLTLDWLQGIIEHSMFPDIEFNPKYRPEKLPFKGKIFKQIWDIYEGSTKICTLSFEPNSKILPTDMISIKFANGFLYCSTLKERVETFFSENNIKLKYWSRIDVALDFTEFNNNINPETFIKRVKRDIYLKTGNNKSQTIDRQTNITTYEYLKYGTYNCDVSVKLYNKTKEQKEVALKKHIAESWLKCGFDIDDIIWRLEFNINNCRKYYLNKDTGEIFDTNSMDMLQDYNVALLYSHLVKQYFKFKINNYTKNKSRMKEKKLLDLKQWDSNLIEFEQVAQAGRAEKMLIKTMAEHNKNIRCHTHPNETEFNYVLHQFIKDKGLERWAIEKGYL